MRKKRPRVNWFLVIILVVLILMVSYINRFVIPTVESPFIPTATATRQPESYFAEAEEYVAAGKFIQAIDSYLEAILIDPDNASLYIALARAQIFAGRYDVLESIVELSQKYEGIELDEIITLFIYFSFALKLRLPQMPLFSPNP